MELANCKRDLAHARAQLIQAWFGARAVENAPMDDSVDPMQLVVTDEVLPEDSDQEAWIGASFFVADRTELYYVHMIFFVNKCHK